MRDGAIELRPDPDRPAAWTLVTGGFPQSHVDLDDPRYLEFEYVRRLGHLVDLVAPASEPIRVLHLGGGGLTLARYVASTRPGSSQLAVDNDEELVATVENGCARSAWTQERLGRPDQVPRGDARAVLEQLSPAPLTSWWPTSLLAAALPPT